MRPRNVSRTVWWNDTPECHLHQSNANNNNNDASMCLLRFAPIFHRGPYELRMVRKGGLGGAWLWEEGVEHCPTCGIAAKHLYKKEEKYVSFWKNSTICWLISNNLYSLKEIAAEIQNLNKSKFPVKFIFVKSPRLCSSFTEQYWLLQHLISEASNSSNRFVSTILFGKMYVHSIFCY